MNLFKRLIKNAPAFLAALFLCFWVATSVASASTNQDNETEKKQGFKDKYESEFDKYHSRLKEISAKAVDTLNTLNSAQKPFEQSVVSVRGLQADLLEIHATLSEGGALYSSVNRLLSWSDQNILRIRSSERYNEEQKSRYIKNYNDLIKDITAEQNTMLVVKGNLEVLKSSFALAEDDLAESKIMEDARLALTALQDYLAEVNDLVDTALNPKQINGVLEGSKSKAS